MLDVVHEKDNLQQLRLIMQNFYSPLKKLDPYLEFTFITGITQSPQLTHSRGIDHFEDISMAKDFSDICGISEKELINNMSIQIEKLGKSLKLSRNECINALHNFCGGYHFSEVGDEIFNPSDLMISFKEGKLENCVTTSKDDYLIKLWRRHLHEIKSIENKDIN